MKLGYVVLAASVAACTDGTLAVVAQSDTSADAGYIDAGEAGAVCAIQDDAHVFASADDVRMQVTGTWSQCGGAKLAGSPLDTEGLRLTTQDVHFLHVNAHGVLAGSDDLGANGTLATIDGDGAGDEGWRLVFTIGIDPRAFRVRVSSDGLLLLLDDVAGGVQSTFVRLR